ncbi:MAG: hypothetical protein ABIQ95_08100 [Bdellovibrionia bacterium]
MPNILLSIDECSVVMWEDYLVVTLLSHLKPHHVSLLDECVSKKDVFKKVPTIFDCSRMTDISPREREFILKLRDILPRFAILSNDTLTQAFKLSGVSGQIPIASDFKSALHIFGLTYQPKLDVSLVNAFVESAMKVVSAQTGQLPKVGKPIAQKSPVMMDLFGIIPAYSSHFSGTILLSFSDAALKALFVSVFGYEPTAIQHEAESFLSEILELIHESTRTELLKKGFVFYPSSASVVRKANLSEHLSQKQIFLNVPFSYNENSFQVCIGVEGL